MPISSPVTTKFLLTLMTPTIDIDDIRLPNMLQAPECPLGLPSLPSPLSNTVHSWRVIDFELAEKINYSVNHLSIDYSPALVRMYEEARTTYVDDDPDGWSHYAGSDEDDGDDSVDSWEDRSSD